MVSSRRKNRIHSESLYYLGWRIVCDLLLTQLSSKFRQQQPQPFVVQHFAFAFSPVLRCRCLIPNDKIHIDPFGETRFIFTGELQSCSIHVKYDYDFIGKDGKHEPKMTVFHHNRRSQFGIYSEEGHYRNELGFDKNQ